MRADRSATSLPFLLLKGNGSSTRAGENGPQLGPTTGSCAVTLCWMLDPRIYRMGLTAVLLAVIVLAFSLGDQPGPQGTTLAPQAFNTTSRS